MNATKKDENLTSFNPIQDGGSKGLSSSFSSVTLTNVGISPPKLSDI